EAVETPSTNSVNVAVPVPVPEIAVIPSTSGESTTGAGGRATTISSGETLLCMPPTFCEAATRCPATSGTWSETAQRPSAPAADVAVANPSMDSWTSARGTAVPPTVLVPSTSGASIVGEGGRATTVTGALNALVMPSTDWRAATD